MTQHAALDNVTHKRLRVKRNYAPGGGYDVNVARVYPSEFARAQVDYPMFFVKNPESNTFETVALLGFHDGENLFLNEDGWDALHVPLTILRQPFLIGFEERVEDGVPQQVPVVHIDLDHPSVSEAEGEPVFLEHGGESPLLQEAASVLKLIHESQDASTSLSKMIEGLELVESVDLQFEFSDGSKHSVSGLFTINEDKLRELNASALASLHEKGHLRDIYLLLASQHNLGKLVQRKNRRLAG